MFSVVDGNGKGVAWFANREDAEWFLASWRANGRGLRIEEPPCGVRTGAHQERDFLEATAHPDSPTPCPIIGPHQPEVRNDPQSYEELAEADEKAKMMDFFKGQSET